MFSLFLTTQYQGEPEGEGSRPDDVQSDGECVNALTDEVPRGRDVGGIEKSEISNQKSAFRIRCSIFDGHSVVIRWSYDSYLLFALRPSTCSLFIDHRSSFFNPAGVVCIVGVPCTAGVTAATVLRPLRGLALSFDFCPSASPGGAAESSPGYAREKMVNE